MTVKVSTRKFYTREKAEEYVSGLEFVKGYTITEISEEKFKYILAFAQQ